LLILDLGPVLPQRPVKPQILVDEPKLPPGEEGDPRIEPELCRYTAACAAYERAAASFKAERAAWERDGAKVIVCNATSGAEMIERGQGRYVVAPDGVTMGPHWVWHSR
jgi:hypothetical protein